MTLLKPSAGTMDASNLILIADDDSAMRAMLSVSLQHRGYGVEEYDSGTTLLAALEEMCEAGTAPSLVVSDVQMPGATGLDVLHWIGQNLPDLPVILITAFGDRRTHRRAQELGAVLVVDKPFSLADLENRITQVLDERDGPIAD
ncbi:MAG: response regulator [Myxococcales bacterium]|nr:response regulator [Myxococcales bacterium]